MKKITLFLTGIFSCFLVCSKANASGDNTATLDGDVNRGKTLYQACATCHGAKGEGNEMLKGPAVAGQLAGYLVEQLNLYKKGVRGTDTPQGQIMRQSTAILVSEKDILDVVSYIITLQVRPE